MAKRRSPRARKLQKIALIAAAVTLISMLVVAGGIGSVLYSYTRDIADIDEAALRGYRPKQITRVYSSDDQLIGEIFEQRRTMVRHAEIPKHVESAFLAAEDADFYNHKGMDYMGMARAMLANLRAGKIRQGASTITQQVVKNFILTPERTLKRKVQELILARRLELVLGKQQILELYLNELFFGHARYGVEEASHYYFGKGVREINIGQGALLAALLKAPSSLSPFKNPTKAKARQVYVLEQMVNHGFASAAKVQPFIDGPLELDRTPSTREVVKGAEEIVDVVHRRLVEHYGKDGLSHLGGRVITSVDMRVQRQARKAVSDGLLGLDRRRENGRATKAVSAKRAERVLRERAGKANPPGTTAMAVVRQPPSELVASLPKAGFSAKLGDDWVFVPVADGGRFDDPQLEWSEQFVDGGLVKVRIAKPDPSAEPLPQGWLRGALPTGAESCVIVADTDTGELVAMVGGSRYRRSGFNRAMAAKRQPGSSFKPFVYGAAIDSRKFTAATIISDSPDVIESWRPTNFERDVYRGDIRIRTAITHSVNTVAIKLLEAVGADRVAALARRAGVESKLAEHPSLALGTSEVTPYELLRAYLTLARQGSRLEPRLIRRVEAVGLEDWEPGSEAEQVMDSGVAAIVTSLMESVVRSGTGRGAQKLGRPVAGKTGTSASHRDAWFAGFTADHVAVAWVGYDRPKSLGKRETGGRAALPVWLAAMQAAEHDVAPRAFSPPPSVSVRQIDAKTGLLASPVQMRHVRSGTADGADVLEELFLQGTEPTEFANSPKQANDEVLLDLYGEDTIDGENGPDSSGTGGGDRPSMD